MLKRIVIKSIKNRKNRILVAILAMVMGASMVSALINISLDLNGKVAKELRAFGANLVLFPGEKGGQNEQTLSMDDVGKLSDSGLATRIYGYAPYLYSIGKLKEQNIVVVGSQFENIRKISPWWKVEGSWNDDNSSESTLMIGAKAAAKLGYKIGDEVVLNIRKDSSKKKAVNNDTVKKEQNTATVSKNRVDAVSSASKNTNVNEVDAVSSASLNTKGDTSKRWPLNILSEIDNGEYVPKQFKLVGIVSTGGSEDNQVFIKLKEAQQLLNKESRANLVQISALTNKSPIEDTAALIEKQIPGIKTRVLSQISKAEGNIQDKILFLMVLVTVLTLAASGLSVMSTMTTTVLERRKEVGMMKAIGAQNKKIAAIFYAEAGTVGLIGGISGYILGVFMAQVVGKSVFNTFIGLHITVIPITLISSILLALLSSKVPVGQAIKIDPVITLRGE